MAANYNDTLKTGRMQLVSDLANSKTIVASSGAGSNGKLVIGTSSLSGATGVLVTLAVPNPAFVISGTGTVIATLQGVPISQAATGTGNAAKAEIRNAADAMVCGGLTVGTTAGFDIIINSVAITTTQIVTVSSGVITHSP